jgi:hypothetical protein
VLDLVVQLGAFVAYPADAWREQTRSQSSIKAKGARR